MRAHVCNFERYAFTKLSINQWPKEPLSSAPSGLYDLQRAQGLPEPHLQIEEEAVSWDKVECIQVLPPLMVTEDLGLGNYY